MFARLGLNTTTPYHFLLYSLTFGGSAFYSFVVSPIVFKKLPRKEFSNLQTQVFPTYFIGQTLSPLVLALTSPFKCPIHLGLLVASSVCGAVNYLYLLPKCSSIKVERQKLEAEKKEDSDEYRQLTKQFGKWHGISSLVNVISIGTLAVYGVFLSKV
jgi:hypothetical protein